MSLTETKEEDASFVLRRTHRRVGLQFVGVAVIVIVSTIALYITSNYVIRSNARQSKVLHLVYAWERLVSIVREAEVSQREFLWAGNERDLREYEEAAGQIPPLLEKIVREEVDPNVVAQLRQLIQKRMAALQAAVELRGKEGGAPPENLVRSGEGKAVMLALRELETKLHLYRENDVAREMKQQDESTRLLTSVFILLGTANFLFLGWSYARISNAIEARDVALLMRYSKHATTPEQD